MMTESLAEHLESLRTAGGTVPMPGTRVVRVWGADAQRWLDDLVTTGVGRLSVGEARRSFLLQPTGKIRAEFWVARRQGDYLLVQPLGQPQAVDALLVRYRLSSEVELEVLDDDVAMLLGDAPAAAVRWMADISHASRTFAAADDPVTPGRRERLVGVRPGSLPASPFSFADLRTAAGSAAFPADLGPESLPLEAPTGDAIDQRKGCYLGQEAIAKTSNRGRPPFVLREVLGGPDLAPGLAISTRKGLPAGEVTSAVDLGDGTRRAMIRIRSKMKDDELAVPGGHGISP